MKAGKVGGAETGSRKRQKKRERKKPYSSSAKKKRLKTPTISFPEDGKLQLELGEALRTSTEKERRHRDSPGKQRGFSSSWLQRGSRCALVGLRRGQNLGKEIEEGSQGLGCMWVWQMMGKEGWDRAGDRRPNGGFEIQWEPGKTGSDDQAGLNVGRESEPGSRK